MSWINKSADKNYAEIQVEILKQGHKFLNYWANVNVNENYSLKIVKTFKKINKYN